jgi:hypothetical protein
MNFSELEAKAGQVADEIKGHAIGIFHHGVAVFSRDLQSEWSKYKAEALVTVKDATPEIQAAVQVALEGAEKLILAQIESHL